MKIIKFGTTGIADVLVTYQIALKYEPGITEEEYYKRIGKELPKKKASNKKEEIGKESNYKKKYIKED